MTKITKQMVVVEQPTIHENLQVETVALFNADGSAYEGGTPSEPVDISGILIPPFTFRGVYDGEVDYVVGDVVIADEEGFKTYRAVADNSDESVLDLDFWERIDNETLPIEFRSSDIDPHLYGYIRGTTAAPIGQESIYGTSENGFVVYSSETDTLWVNDGTGEYPIWRQINIAGSGYGYTDPGDAVAGDGYILLKGGPPTGVGYPGFDNGWTIATVTGVVWKNEGTDTVPDWQEQSWHGQATTSPVDDAIVHADGDYRVQFLTGDNYFIIWLGGPGGDSDWTDVSSTSVWPFVVRNPHNDDQGDPTFVGSYIFSSDSPQSLSAVISPAMFGAGGGENQDGLIDHDPIDGREPYGLPAPIGSIILSDTIWHKHGEDATEWWGVPSGLTMIGEWVEEVDWWGVNGWVNSTYHDDSHGWAAFTVGSLGHDVDLVLGFGNDNEFPGSYAEIFAGESNVGFDFWNGESYGEIYGFAQGNKAQLRIIGVEDQTDPLFTIKDHDGGTVIFSVLADGTFDPPLSVSGGDPPEPFSWLNVDYSGNLSTLGADPNGPYLHWVDGASDNESEFLVGPTYRLRKRWNNYESFMLLEPFGDPGGGGISFWAGGFQAEREMRFGISGLHVPSLHVADYLSTNSAICRSVVNCSFPVVIEEDVNDLIYLNRTWDSNTLATYQIPAGTYANASELIDALETATCDLGGVLLDDFYMFNDSNRICYASQESGIKWNDSYFTSMGGAEASGTIGLLNGSVGAMYITGGYGTDSAIAGDGINPVTLTTSGTAFNVAMDNQFDVVFSIGPDGLLMVSPDLPTSDPEVLAGQVWNDGGTLKVSAGAP